MEICNDKEALIDSVGPGGQAGSSPKIGNFIGFPSVISGGELANRGYLQALKFGTQFIAPITVKSIDTQSSGEHHLQLCTGQKASQCQSAESFTSSGACFSGKSAAT